MRSTRKLVRIFIDEYRNPPIIYEEPFLIELEPEPELGGTGVGGGSGAGYGFGSGMIKSTSKKSKKGGSMILEDLNSLLEEAAQDEIEKQEEEPLEQMALPEDLDHAIEK